MNAIKNKPEPTIDEIARIINNSRQCRERLRELRRRYCEPRTFTVLESKRLKLRSAK